ncbi:hypothetical protein HS7_13840 [Sulfolobales archaeon HS-7]|nr:hypothetical protein HS7_13840 [Sulfolobales archaeon HS-7]
MKSAVIVTIYKRYNYIAQALSSLLNQTIVPEQVIITTDNVEFVKGLPLIKGFQNYNIIEAGYASIGKKIAAAIDYLNNDIDIVFFLEDDDMFKSDKIEYIKRIFEKNDDIVMIHNHQQYIDIIGNKIENFYAKSLDERQPHEDMVINSNNILSIYRHYSNIHHNTSSMGIRKNVLIKYKSFIEGIDNIPDLALFFISLLEGNILHVSRRLTFFRVGSGITSFGKFSSYNDFVEFQHKTICKANRDLKDYYNILKLVKNCNNCRRVVEILIINLEKYLYIYNNYFNCTYKVKLPSYGNFLFKFIKYLLISQMNISEFSFSLIAITMPLLFGKRRTPQFLLIRHYKNIQNNNI